METASTRGVIKNYGVRATGGAHGQYKSIGPVKSLSFKMNLEFLEDAVAGNAGLNTFLASGITVTSAKVIVHTAFDDTAAITFTGTDSEDATQGTFPIAATELGTVGVVDITPTSNYASGEVTTLASDITVASAVAGSTEGEAELLIEYIQTSL